MNGRNHEFTLVVRLSDAEKSRYSTLMLSLAAGRAAGVRGLLSAVNFSTKTVTIVGAEFSLIRVGNTVEVNRVAEADDDFWTESDGSSLAGSSPASSKGKRVQKSLSSAGSSSASSKGKRV